ncbi:MAG: peptidase M23 [Crocinitomicaceae bacterium]|nr:peptidase M23 [Crocinitomicaceae bacterium]
MRSYVFIILSILSLSVKSQTKQIIDTLLIEKDSIVVYNNKSWEYLFMLNFDGILNPELDSFINQEFNNKITQPWDNYEPYVINNDLSVIKDSIWLCVVDEQHPNYSLPSPGKTNSRFGPRGKRYHRGIDLGFNNSDSIFCTFDGIVRYAKYNSGGYGNLVIIRHYNGLETFYAHLRKIKVSTNQQITAGQYIGKGGATGRVSGPHLHFEVRFYGNALDPELIFDFKNNCLFSENLFIHRNTFSYAKKYGRVYSSSVKYHTIKSGDTLYGLALKYGISLNKICKLNTIKPSKILKIGEKIRIQ